MADIFDQVASGQVATSSAPAASSNGGGDIFDQVASGGTAQTQQAGGSSTTPSGQITNDVGNTVVVPKDGESFSDTMQRAAAYGKTVTSSQVNAEMKTAPGKAATVVGAAPVIGAAGAAALAAPGEIVQGIRALPGVGEALLQHAEEKAAAWAAQYPHLIALGSKLGIPTGAAALLGWMVHQAKSK